MNSVAFIDTPGHPPVAREKSRARVLAGATIGCMIGLSSAIHSVFGLFLIPLSNDFGWSRTAISGGLALLAFLSIFVCPTIGRIADRVGAWPVAFSGVFFFATVMACGSLLTGQLWQWYLFYAMITVGATMVGCSFFLQMLSETHRRDFGFAAGFSAGVGTGSGGVLMPILAAVLMARYGWRVTYIGIGISILVVGLLAMTLLKDVGKKPRKTPGEHHAVAPLAAIFRRFDFWLIAICFAFTVGISMAIVGHIVPILAERGVGTVVATAAVVAQAIASGTTQPTLGWLLDRFGLRVLPPLFLMNVLSLVLFCFTANTMLCVLAGAALGIGIGMQFCAIPFLVNLRFGLNSFGSVMGLMYAAIFLGEGIGPLILDLVYDNIGSYLPALLATLVVMLAATLCSTILSRISVRTGGDTMQPHAA